MRIHLSGGFWCFPFCVHNKQWPLTSATGHITRDFDILIDVFEAHLQVIIDKYLELNCVCSLTVKIVQVRFLNANWKNRQKSFSLTQKVKILKCLNEPGMTRKKVREKYDLGESTLRGFIKNTKKLFETFNSSSLESAKRKRQWDGEYPELYGFPAQMFEAPYQVKLWFVKKLLN